MTANGDRIKPGNSGLVGKFAPGKVIICTIRLAAAEKSATAMAGNVQGACNRSDHKGSKGQSFSFSKGASTDS